jgi:hypothetical protein
MDKMYVKLNDSPRVFYDESFHLTQSVWRPWIIELSQFGESLSNISSFSIGFEKVGTTDNDSTVLVDDICLYRIAPEIIEPVDPGSENLIAYYTFENNVQDSSGNGYHGAIVGDPLYVKSVTTDYSKALEFDDDDCVDLGSADHLNFTGSFSISFWANIQDWSDEWSHVMIGTRGESVGFSIRRGGGWIASQQNPTASSEGLSFTTRGIGTADTDLEDMLTIDPPSIGDWTHIACVYDQDNNMKTIYLAGVNALELATDPDGSLNPAPEHNGSLGARANEDNTEFESFFTGMLDDLRIYDRALSEGEVIFLADPTP